MNKRNEGLDLLRCLSMLMIAVVQKNLIIVNPGKELEETDE